MTAETVNDILDCAQRLVQRRGFHAFSYRDIAGEVGIRAASIHYYFPTKCDLAEAVLARLRERLAETLDAIGQEPDLRQRLATFVGGFRQTLADADQLCPFCMIGTAQDTVPPAVREQVQAFFSTAEHWLADLLALGESQGAWQLQQEAGAAARALVAALEGGMILARVFGDINRFEETITLCFGSLGLDTPVHEEALV